MASSGNGSAAYAERSFSAQDGLQLYFRDYGDPLSPGHPLLCLCGLTRNSKDFHDLATRHADKRRVITFDYRGRGRSAYDANWRNYRPETYLSDIVHLIAASGLHNLVLCGTSLGGLLSMGLSVALPSALSGVILNDVGPRIEAHAAARIIQFVGSHRAFASCEDVISHMRALLPTMASKDQAWWVKFANATYREGEDGQWHPDWDPAIIRPLQKNDNRAHDLWHYFRALRNLPVLAIRGKPPTF